ncbi:MAG: hypothetical protein GC168_02215 [Candidatus Hydrogenedens sp.]|nr:hypothetical protein [Candidatus Hydrogenedens sp.]
MDGAFGRPKAKRFPVINITPLIDVMFLLLIFFMVSSTFRERLGLDVALPQSEAATEQEISRFEIAVSETGDFSYGEAEGLTAEQLESMVRKDLEQDPERVIDLRGDKGARYEAYIEALGVLKKVGAERVNLVTRPAEPGAASASP